MKFTSMAKVLSILMSTALVAGVALADDQDMKVKVVELKAVKDKEIKIELVDDQANVIEITDAELADEYLLQEKLANLDEDTRILIRKTIDGLKGDGATSVFVHDGDVGHSALKKVFVMDKSDNHIINLDEDVEHSFIKKGKMLVVNTDGDYMNEVKLKGVSDAIIRMIKMGEFTPDELDEIQSALDQKR